MCALSEIQGEQKTKKVTVGPVGPERGATKSRFDAFPEDLGGKISIDIFHLIDRNLENLSDKDSTVGRSGRTKSTPMVEMKDSVKVLSQ